MSRKCIAMFSNYHKTTLKKVVFKPDDRSTPSHYILMLTKDILTTSSRDGSVYIWDLRCTGIQSQAGPPRYKPTASILGGHPVHRGRKMGEMVQGSAITGLAWSANSIVTACDANSCLPPSRNTPTNSGCRVIKVWDPRTLNALSTKAPVAIETSKQPRSHTSRPYGITSIATQNNRIFALSKDSQYSPSKGTSNSLVSMHLTSAT